MKFTDKEKNDFFQSVTEQLIKDKNFGEVIRKIHIGGTEQPNEMSKELKTITFFKSLMTGDLAKAKAISGDTASDGGILIPTEFKTDIIDRIVKQVISIRKYATVLPVAFRSGQVPALNNGVVVKFSASDSATETSGDGSKETTPVFDKISYVVNRIEGYTSLSNDLLNDVPEALYNILVGLYADAFMKTENDAYLNGSGTGMPQGIRGVATGTPVTVDGSLAVDVLSLPYNVPAYFRDGGVYLASTNAIRLLRVATDKNGQFLWSPASAGQLPTFGGYPVLECPFIPENLGVGTNETEIVFGNLKNYIIFDRNEYTLEVNTTSDTAFFGNTTIVKLQNRLDGKVANSAAFVKLTGIKVS